MKKLNRISPGSYLILSDQEMQNVAGGYAPGKTCNPYGETCGGSCGAWIESPEGSVYVQGICQISPEVMNLCGCIIGGGSGGGI